MFDFCNYFYHTKCILRSVRVKPSFGKTLNGFSASGSSLEVGGRHSINQPLKVYINGWGVLNSCRRHSRTLLGAEKAVRADTKNKSGGSA